MTGLRSAQLRRVFALVALLAGLALLPWIAGPRAFLVHVLVQCFMWSVLAASWDLLVGYTGQTSFGHAGFFALGAYTVALSNLHFGLPPWAGFVAAGFLSALFGFLLGIPGLRLRGVYLAIITLGFSEVFRIVMLNWVSFTGGPAGAYDYMTFQKMAGSTAGGRLLAYYLGLCVATLSLGFMRWLGHHSAIGMVFKGVREDEVLAESYGHNVRWYKLVAFVLSGLFAGVAGAFYALYVGTVSPVAGEVYITALAVTMVVIGGMGTIYGPAIGALLVYGATEYLRFVKPVYNLMIIGFIMMVVIVFFPRGLYGGVVWALRQARRSSQARRAMPAPAKVLQD